mmetsp:Transcript_12926/g.29259  ORF Transcript_12926/g.29259 Transcript_12926/m.29259 type:complete len:487 (+) Transcript_12926:104-1564(+)|eukprot:6481657-Amphidinium_carterae.2
MAIFRSVLALGVMPVLAMAGSGPECTKGLLFISDETSTTVHVYDLDGNAPEETSTLVVAAPATGLYATETELSHVVVRNRADTAVQGSVQFIRSGLSAEDHGVETHVVKGTPTIFDFHVTGWRPTHLTSSEGYIAIFMDASAEHNYNSSAVFVEEAAIQSMTATSDVTEIHLAGAHHGVAYALGGGRFLTTVTPSSGFILPDNLIMTDAAGTVIEQVGSEETPSCPGYHGAAHLDHTWMLGCASGGLLRVSYDPHASTPSLQWDRLENPLDGSFRTGTVRSSKGGGVFVADFYNSSVSGAQPRHLWSVLPTTGEAFEQHLMSLERVVDERSDCSYVLDRAAATSTGGVLAVVMHDEGNLTITLIGADGMPGAGKDVPIFSGGLGCEHLAMVAGYGEVYILDSNAPQLVTVDLREALEGTSDAVKMYSLPFTPSSAALSLPPSLACNHDDVTTTTTTTGEDVNSALSNALSTALVALVCAMLALRLA